MNGRKRSVGIAALALTAVLLTPLLGCHHSRRDSRSSRYQSHQSHEYQRQAAADQRRRHEYEQRRLAEDQRRERERRDWRRDY